MSNIAKMLRVVRAAKIIFDAVSIRGGRVCIHGNGTRYPTHAWYCDVCWLELEEALEDLPSEITERAEG